MGSNPDNDLTDIIRACRGRIPFAHVRNLKYNYPGDFEEAAHLSSDGSLDKLCIRDRDTSISNIKEEKTMIKCLECINWKQVAVFAGGVLFGTAGVKVLGSQDAKKVYVNCVAAGLRAKECVMTLSLIHILVK